jgi:hypothetical protein
MENLVRWKVRVSYIDGYLYLLSTRFILDNHIVAKYFITGEESKLLKFSGTSKFRIKELKDWVMKKKCGS